MTGRISYHPSTLMDSDKSSVNCALTALAKCNGYGEKILGKKSSEVQISATGPEWFEKNFPRFHTGTVYGTVLAFLSMFILEVLNGNLTYVNIKQRISFGGKAWETM